MLYLLWGILNIGLFIIFIVICFRAIRLIKEKMGVLAAVIYILGFSLLGGSSKSNHYSNQPKNPNLTYITFNTRDKVEDSSVTSLAIVLEETLVSKYQLDLIYGREKLSKMFIPLTASSNILGFISGINWKPLSIQVHQVRHDAFFYSVDGTTEWKLFNATLYSQGKNYSGTTQVK